MPSNTGCVRLEGVVIYIEQMLHHDKIYTSLNYVNALFYVYPKRCSVGVLTKYIIVLT